MTPDDAPGPADDCPATSIPRAGMTETWADLSSTVALNPGETIVASRPRGSGGGPKADLERFSRDLVAAGLIDAATLQSIRARCAAQASPLGAELLARELVRDGRLTPYQAAAVLQGKTRGLSIGNYLILDKLGEGGMGLVFKAQHRRLKRVVALKILPPSFTGNPAAVLRFQREAEAAAHLAHPNIVAAIDADEFKGLHFLVMEYVDGRDLARLVRELGPLPLSQAIDFVIQAAQGLREAHEHEIFHRDIKPSNLLLEAGGAVKVSDLGLARLGRNVAELGAPAAGTADLTRDGAIMGTVDFMPPEQAYNSRLADGRSDIYSLGCTLYFLLTGQVPFPAETLMARLLAHRELPFPSVRQIRPEASPELDALLARMTAKAPEARPQTVQAVLDALSALPDRAGSRLSVDPDPATTAPDATSAQPAMARRLPPLSRPVVIAATTGLILTTLALIVDSRRTRTGELVVRTGGHDVRLQLSKDGRPIGPATDRRFFELIPGTYEIELVNPPPSLAVEPAEITVVKGGRVMVKVVERIVPPPKPPAPPRERPAAAAASPVSPPTIPTTAADEPPGLVRRFEHGGGSVWSVAVSADGSRVYSAGQDRHLRSWSLATGAAQPALGHDTAVFAVALSTGGRLVATGAGDGVIRLFEANTGRGLGALTGHTRKVNALAIDAAGSLVLSGSDDGTALLWECDPVRERAAIRHAGPVVAVAFARAGQRALVLGHDGSLIQADTETGSELSRRNSRGAFLSLTVAPAVTGRTFAFGGTESGRIAVWDLTTDATERTLDGGPIDWVNGLAPLPDGRRLLVAYQGGRLLLWDTIEGRVAATLDDHGAGAGHLALCLTPDGRFAMTGDDDGFVRVWRLPLNDPTRPSNPNR